MSKENEIWKDIVGYECCYQVSNLGNVRSINGAILRKDGTEQYLKGKVLAKSIRRQGMEIRPAFSYLLFFLYSFNIWFEYSLQLFICF